MGPNARGPGHGDENNEDVSVDTDLVKTRVHLRPVQVLGHVRRSCNDRRTLVCPVRVLLHVLRKVRLLRVTLSTVGADVCLYMLGLLVLGDVLKEGLFVGEALVAGVALVRLVSLVAARVGLQVRQLGEGLRATWEGKKGSENNFRQEIYHCGQKEACPDFLRAVNCFCRWITSIAAKSVPQQRIFYGPATF